MGSAMDPALRPLPSGVLSDAEHAELKKRVHDAPKGQKMRRKKELKEAVNASLKADVKARANGWQPTEPAATEPPVADATEQSEPHRLWYQQEGPMA